MRYIALLALLLPLVVGRIQAQQAPDNMTAQVLTTYADIVYATYEDTLTLTLEMQPIPLRTAWKQPAMHGGPRVSRMARPKRFAFMAGRLMLSQIQ